MTDHGRAGGMREHGRAGGKTSHGGDERGVSQGGAEDWRSEVVSAAQRQEAEMKGPPDRRCWGLEVPRQALDKVG